MSNQQPQQQQQKSAEWKPSANTRILIQSSDGKFENRARNYFAKKYGKGIINQQTGETRPHRIGTELNGNGIGESTTVIVLYFDPEAPVFDKKADGGKGEYRDRDMGERAGGKTVRDAEDPDVKETRPVACKQFWNEGGEDSDGGIDLNALVRELNKQMHPAARVVINDRDKHPMLSVQAT